MKIINTYLSSLILIFCISSIAIAEDITVESTSNSSTSAWVSYSNRIGRQNVSIMFPADPYVDFITLGLVEDTVFNMASYDDEEIKMMFGSSIHFQDPSTLIKSLGSGTNKKGATIIGKENGFHVMDYIRQDHEYFHLRVMADENYLFIFMVNTPAEYKNGQEFAQFFLDSFTLIN